MPNPIIPPNPWAVNFAAALQQDDIIIGDAEEAQPPDWVHIANPYKKKKPSKPKEVLELNLDAKQAYPFEPIATIEDLTSCLNTGIALYYIDPNNEGVPTWLSPVQYMYATLKAYVPKGIVYKHKDQRVIILRPVLENIDGKLVGRVWKGHSLLQWHDYTEGPLYHDILSGHSCILLEKGVVFNG